jgi:putative hemolysin
MKSRTRIILIVMLLLFVSTNLASALKNPSGVYCKEQGYEYITATMPDGGQRGFCILPDDQIVDAWEFLEGKVGQEYSYCEKEGYEIKTVADSEACSRIFTYECAVCILEDGTEVEVTELMNLSFIESVCGDGTCGLPENFETCPEDCPSGELDEYCDGLADGICDPDCEETGEYDPDCQAPAPTSIFLLTAVAVAIIIIVVIIVSVIVLRRGKKEE